MCDKSNKVFENDFIYRLRPATSLTMDELQNHYLWFSKPEGFNDVNDANIGAFMKNTKQLYDVAKMRMGKQGVDELCGLMTNAGICCFTNTIVSESERCHFPKGKSPSVLVEYNRRMLLSRNKPGKESNPSYFKGTNLPVENVSWYDCQNFIKKLNEKTGRNFRLPTTAEWKCAAGLGLPLFADRSIAWFSCNSGGSTHPVESKMSDKLGLFDILGNVLEWTEEGDLCGGSYKSTDIGYSTDSPTYTNVNPLSCDSFIGLRLAE